MKKLIFILLTVFTMNTSFGQAEAFLGEIRIWPGNFAPYGWAFCNGQTMSISQNTALYSLLGTTYGGNGQTTFNLPDLRGRFPMGSTNGMSPMGTQNTLGQMGGNSNITLLPSNLPIGMGQPVKVQKNDTTGVVLQPVGPGMNSPVSVQNPYLTIQYIICLQGIYPSRN